MIFRLIFDTILANLLNVDGQVATWFHQHLTHAFAGVMMLMSDPGAAVCVGPVTAFTAGLLIWKRLWNGLLALGLTVPGGMILNEILKITIRRERPFHTSPYIDISGYSFPSGHTMAASLLYGLLAIFILSMLRGTFWRLIVISGTTFLILVVSFSRIALGAHHVSDVFAALLISSAWLFLSLQATGKVCRKTFSPDLLQSK